MKMSLSNGVFFFFWVHSFIFVPFVLSFPKWPTAIREES